MHRHFFHLIVFALLLPGCRSSILEDPSLSIQFSVVQSSHVLLTVENSYNTVIATLVDTDLPPGSHQVTLNPANLQSGIYFYTLECRGINNTSYSKVTKQLLMIK